MVLGVYCNIYSYDLRVNSVEYIHGTRDAMIFSWSKIVAKPTTSPQRIPGMGMLKTLEPRKKKNGLTFHFTGCLIGILIMVYHNPYITG